MDKPTPAAPATPAVDLGGLGLAPAEPETPVAEPAAVTPAVPAAAVVVEEPEETPPDPAVVAQANNPDAVSALIAAERKTAREANARARELQAQLEAEQTAAKPLPEQIAQSDLRAAEAEMRATRLEVAAEAGLDLKLASRLTGSTREELVADAATFKTEIGAPAAVPAVLPEGGVRVAAPAAPDPAAAHNSLLGAVLGHHQSQRQATGGQSILSALEPAPQDD